MIKRLTLRALNLISNLTRFLKALFSCSWSNSIGKQSQSQPKELNQTYNVHSNAHAK